MGFSFKTVLNPFQAFQEGKGGFGNFLDSISGATTRDLAARQFDEQMDQTIQRRVVDAKAAGIHPLFALGASAGASPTVHAGGGGASALDAVRGVAGLMGIGGRGGRAPSQSADLAVAQIGGYNASANRDETQAQLNLARVAEIQGRSMAANDGLGPNDGPAGLIESVRPRVPTSFPGQKGVTAGVQPGTIMVRTPDGGKITILSPELGLDEIAQVDYVWQRAKQKGGDAVDAVRRAIKQMATGTYKYLRNIPSEYPRY